MPWSRPNRSASKLFPGPSNWSALWLMPFLVSPETQTLGTDHVRRAISLSWITLYGPLDAVARGLICAPKGRRCGTALRDGCRSGPSSITERRLAADPGGSRGGPASRAERTVGFAPPGSVAPPSCITLGKGRPPRESLGSRGTTQALGGRPLTENLGDGLRIRLSCIVVMPSSARAQDPNTATSMEACAGWRGTLRGGQRGVNVK